MTPRQTERLSLYRQVINNCNENSASALPGSFPHYLHGFRSAVAAVYCIDYLVSCVQEHKIPDTGKLYDLLVSIAEATAHSLLDIAINSNDRLLHQKTTYALSHIRVLSPDIRAASLVTIAETLDERLHSLEAYGMNDNILTALKIGIENYMGIAPRLSSILFETEAYQLCFRNVLHTAGLLLKERIDPLMEELSEEHHLFYLSYRRIRTYGEINYLL
jgi:hypothetical protein